MLRAAFLLGWVCSAAIGAQTVLFAVGGGPRPDEGMKRFVQHAGGTHAKILVVPWASIEPDGYYQAMHDSLLPYKPKAIDRAVALSEVQAKPQNFLKQLEEATAVFFCGGDQMRYLKLFQSHPEVALGVRAAFRAGKPVGGTSAGTAILSTVALSGLGQFDTLDGQAVHTMRGLGLIENAILDQHFVRRSRWNRLFGLVLKHGDLSGIGIDEGTALFVVDGVATVIGASHVVRVRAEGKKKTSVELFRAGETLRLGEGVSVEPSDPMVFGRSDDGRPVCSGSRNRD